MAPAVFVSCLQIMFLPCYRQKRSETQYLQGLSRMRPTISGFVAAGNVVAGIFHIQDLGIGTELASLIQVV